MSEDFRTDALIFADAVEGLSKDVEALEIGSPLLDDEVGVLFTIREVLAAGAATLLALRQDFDTKLGQAIGPDYVDVGGHRYQRYGRYSSASADKDEQKARDAQLLRAVLDSRRFNKATGELIEESPLDRVTHVWNLPAYGARRGALKERDIDPGEFIRRERVGWTISVDR